MRITRQHLRRIIKEFRILKEGTLFVTRGDYGYIGLEDDSGNDYALGEVVAELLDAGITNIFMGSGGVDEKSLQSLLAKRDEEVQGGIERWDSDVFGEYYNVDTDVVIDEFAKLKSLTVQEASEEDMDEYPEQEQARREMEDEEEAYAAGRPWEHN
jgi:hypothetical protein